MNNQFGLNGALRNDPNLARYVVTGQPTGMQLGSGSYGTVEEIEVEHVEGRLICAGKKIHETLIDTGNTGAHSIIERYLRECQLMSRLQHPNITQFLGLCFLPNYQLPMLVMEKLDRSLDNFLETVPNIPIALKWSVLEDVARGLLYLHSHNPAIIHRDLTAANVLLTSSLVAKITDLGNSRIVNPEQAQRLTQMPGTQLYMPPEALTHYDTSLDIFSYGHLTLFTLTQVFPGKLLLPNYPNPENSAVLIGRSEVERREEYFKLLEGGSNVCIHSLSQLAKACLHNYPSRRPSAERVLLSLIGDGTDAPCRELEKQIAIQQMKRLEVGDEVQRLQQQLDLTQLTLKEKDTELQQIITDAQQAVYEERQKLSAEFAQQKDEEVKKVCVEFNEELQRKDQLLRAIVEDERQQMEEHLRIKFLRMKEEEVQQARMQLQQQMNEICEQMKEEHQMELEQLKMQLQYTHNE